MHSSRIRTVYISEETFSPGRYNSALPTFILTTSPEVVQTHSARAFFGKKKERRKRLAYTIVMNSTDSFSRVHFARRKRPQKGEKEKERKGERQRERNRGEMHLRQMELARENVRSVLRNAPGNLFYRVVKTKVYLAKWENFVAQRKGLRVNATSLHVYVCTYAEYRDKDSLRRPRSSAQRVLSG